MRKLIAAALLFALAGSARAQTAANVTSEGVPVFIPNLGGTPAQIRQTKAILSFVFCDAEPGTDYLQFWDSDVPPVLGTSQPTFALDWPSNAPLNPVLRAGILFSKGAWAAIMTSATGTNGAGPAACTFGFR
jgi:hypothetical protein